MSLRPWGVKSFKSVGDRFIRLYVTTSDWNKLGFHRKPSSGKVVLRLSSARFHPYRKSTPKHYPTQQTSEMMFGLHLQCKYDVSHEIFVFEMAWENHYVMIGVAIVSETWTLSAKPRT
eukprot:1709923-Amphidinium_carterae.1